MVEISVIGSVLELLMTEKWRERGSEGKQKEGGPSNLGTDYQRVLLLLPHLRGD